MYGLVSFFLVRAIFELAVAQPLLDMPELLWKAYIDHEFNEKEYDRTRALYERLLERTEHVKVVPSQRHHYSEMYSYRNRAEKVCNAG